MVEVTLASHLFCNAFLIRFCLGVQRTQGRPLSTLVKHLVSHTATQSLMFAQREGSLSEQEEREIAEATRLEEVLVFECTLIEFLLEVFANLLLPLIVSCWIFLFQLCFSYTLQHHIADF